jgi:hypothetical protein
VTFDGGDERFGEEATRGAERTVAIGIDVVTSSFGNGFEIGASAERAAFAVKDGDGGCVVAFEFVEGFREGVCGRAVDGVLPFRPMEEDGEDGAVLLDSDAHDVAFFVFW